MKEGSYDHINEVQYPHAYGSRCGYLEKYVLKEREPVREIKGIACGQEVSGAEQDHDKYNYIKLTSLFFKFHLALSPNGVDAKNYSMVVPVAKILRAILLTTGICPLCGENSVDGSSVCDRCSKNICRRESGESRDIAGIREWRAFSPYDGIIAEAIRAVKFAHLKPLAGLLGEKIASDLADFRDRTGCELITYVPVHWRRRIGRGFDHCEEILRGTGLEFSRVLVRVKYSKPLAQLSREERIGATEDAFRVPEGKRELIRGRKVLLFDDILTTGSTSSSAARELMRAGAREVFLYTVAVQK